MAGYAHRAQAGRILPRNGCKIGFFPGSGASLPSSHKRVYGTSWLSNYYYSIIMVFSLHINLCFAL
jgi:hypothetical protein